MRKTLKILFVLSVLANLLVVGTVAGFAARWYWGDKHNLPPGAMHARAFAHIIEDIPDTTARDALIAQFDALKIERQAQDENIRQSRRTIRQLVETEPFDATAYDAEIKKMLQLKSSNEQAQATLLREIIAVLPADERKDALKLLYRGKGWKGGHHRQPGSERDDD